MHKDDALNYWGDEVEEVDDNAENRYLKLKYRKLNQIVKQRKNRSF